MMLCLTPYAAGWNGGCEHDFWNGIATERASFWLDSKRRPRNWLTGFIRAEGFNTPLLAAVKKVLNPECNSTGGSARVSTR